MRGSEEPSRTSSWPGKPPKSEVLGRRAAASRDGQEPFAGLAGVTAGPRIFFKRAETTVSDAVLANPMAILANSAVNWPTTLAIDKDTGVLAAASTPGV